MLVQTVQIIVPVVVQRQVPDGRDSAENCGVSAVGPALGQGC